MSTFTQEQEAILNGGDTSGKTGGTFDRLLKQESGGRQFNTNGGVVTSSKGATGIAQVMPATGPEAAKLAGVEWNPERFKSDPEYNKSLGRAYFDKQLATFGNERLALAAYNAGPGAVQKAIRRAEKSGGDPLAYLPEETQKYVPAILGAGFGVKRAASSPWSQQPKYVDPGFNKAIEHEALQDAADESPVSTSLERGWEGLKHNAGLFLDNVADDSQGAAERIKAKREWDDANPAPRSSTKFVEQFQQLAEDDYAGMLATAVKNPGGALNQMVEQTPNSLPALALQIPVGIASSALLATGWGAPLAMGLQGLAAFVGNALPEGGAYIEEQLGKAGINPNDTTAVAKWIAENRGKNLEGGVKKAGVISLVDGATGYLGGKLIAGPSIRFAQAEAAVFAKAGVKTTDKAAVAAARATPAYKQAMAQPAQELLAATTRAQKTVRELGGLGLETAGEGIGEYAGSYAADGTASVKDAVLESMMGAGTSAAMTGANMTLGAMKGPDGSRADLEALAATPQPAQPTITPNSPLANAASIAQAAQPAQGSLQATMDALEGKARSGEFLTPEEMQQYRAMQAKANGLSDQNRQWEPPSQPNMMRPDPMEGRLRSVAALVEDKAFMSALRSDPRYGKESATDLLAAFAKARNPSLDPKLRERAIADLESFASSFVGPNTTNPKGQTVNLGESDNAQPGQQVAPFQQPGGAVGPAITPDNGRTLNGEVITRPDTMAGANPNQISAPPVLGLPTEEALQAKRDADAAYEQAYQDLVKSESLGASDQDLAAKQQAIREARAAREQADARMQEIERAIEGNRQQQTTEKRRAVLDAILADPATANPAARLAAELKRQGFRDTTPTQAELDTIQRFSDIQNAESDPDIIPSSPNELDPYQVRQERPQQPAKPRLTVEQIKQAIANGATLSKDVLTLPDGSRVKLKGPQVAAARQAILKKAQDGASNERPNAEVAPQAPESGSPVVQGSANAVDARAGAGAEPQDIMPAGVDSRVGQNAPDGNGGVAEPSTETFDVSTRTDDQLRYLAEKGKDGWREAAQAELAKRTPADVSLTDEGKTTQPAEPEAENVDPLDKEISDAAAHLADVLADVFGAKLNITGPQHTAADLLPAMQKVIGLLVQKGFKTFAQAVGQTARMLRDNGAGEHVEKITPRQWKAAYQFAADMPGVEGAESEEAVAALSADKVLAIVSGQVDKAKAEAEARTDTNPSDAQKEAENYRKGKFAWNGQTIAVENPKGSERTGKGEDGAEWRTVMPATYGYFLGTVGADKDHVDVFVGDTLDAPSFWVINQTQPDSAKFDEHKVVAGVTSADEAKRIYLDSFSDGFGDKVFSSIAGPYPVGELADVLPKLKAKKPFGVGSFLDGASPMQAGKLKASLAKQYRFDGEEMTVQERVESLHKSGNLQVSSFEEPKIKPMSRTQFNRADNREQAAHERKMREAGKKTVYLVGESDIGKTAHDYAKHLLAGGATLSDAKAEESPRDAHIRAKEEAYAARREGQPVPPKALEIVRTEAGKEFDKAQDAETLPAGWSKSENGFTGRPAYTFSPESGAYWATIAVPQSDAYDVEYRQGQDTIGKEAMTGKLRNVLAHVEAGVRSRSGEAIHKDPGQPAEAVTPAVVAESIRKSADNTPLGVKEAKAYLLAEIDKAILAAGDKSELEAELAREKAKEFDGKAMEKRGIGSKQIIAARDAFNALRDSNIAKTVEQIGFVTFDVPGDGKFKVANSAAKLQEFRRKVETSPGFKNPAIKPPTMRSETNTGSYGPRDAILEGDYLNAYELAKLQDKPLVFSVGTNNQKPTAYTDTSTADGIIDGIAFVVGREATKDGKWFVIEPATGILLNKNGLPSKVAALTASKALTKGKEDALRKVIADPAKAMPQSTLEAEWLAWAEEQEGVTREAPAEDASQEEPTPEEPVEQEESVSSEPSAPIAESVTNSTSSRINPLDLTPKQYHAAKLKAVADEYSLTPAEVREDYDTDVQIGIHNQEWIDAVRDAFRDGSDIDAKVLDRLHELRPGALASFMHDYPDANVPDGYQTPSARKAEKDAADAKREDRRNAADRRANESAPSEETLIDMLLLRDRGDRWQYKFSIDSNWMTANTKADAVERATSAYLAAPEEKRLTSQQRAKKADAELIANMDQRYGHLSIADLEAKYESLGGVVSDFQRAGAREFDGNGGRRTSAAVSSEGARDAGAEKIRLGIYIKHRIALLGDAAPSADLTNIFAGLSSRGLAKNRAQKAAEAHPRAAQIAYVQDNFMDILTELEDSGLVKINCD